MGTEAVTEALEFAEFAKRFENLPEDDRQLISVAFTLNNALTGEVLEVANFAAAKPSEMHARFLIAALEVVNWARNVLRERVPELKTAEAPPGLFEGALREATSMLAIAATAKNDAGHYASEV